LNAMLGPVNELFDQGHWAAKGNAAVK